MTSPHPPVQNPPNANETAHSQRAIPSSTARVGTMQENPTRGSRTSENSPEDSINPADSEADDRLQDLSPRSYLKPKKAPETLRALTQWLVDFGRSSGLEPTEFGADEIERWVVQPLSRYLSTFRPLAREKASLQGFLSRTDELKGRPLNLTRAHGDFRPAHLQLTGGGRVRVFDSGFSSESRLPLFDLFWLLGSLDYTAASGSLRGNRGRNFSIAFLSPEENPYRASIEESIETARRAFDIEPEWLEWLFVLTWVEGALQKREIAQKRGCESALETGDGLDDVLPVIRFRLGSCENLRDSLERAHRLPWEPKTQ